MAHLLHIDSSPRGERSRSRRFTREFVEAWKQVHPNDTVTYRDIGRNPVPHINEQWIAAGYTPAEQRTPELWQAIEKSDRLVDELLAADIYVMGVPMYNYSVPSGFKAYIDQRSGKPRRFTAGILTKLYGLGELLSFYLKILLTPTNPSY